MTYDFRAWTDAPAIDVYEYLVARAVPEPQKSEWRFAMMGALAALSWVALFTIAYFAAEMLRVVWA